MSQDSFLKQMESLFFRTEPHALSGETRYKELPEWSLPVAVSLLLVVKEESGLWLISGDDIAQTSTLQELYQRVLVRWNHEEKQILS